MTARRVIRWWVLLFACIPIVVAEVVMARGSESPPLDPSDPPFKALGCDDNYVQCVDVCSGRALYRTDRRGNFSQLIVSEDELVTVRAIGNRSCAPATLSCTSHTVSVNNVGFIPAPAGSGSAVPTSPGDRAASMLSAAAGPPPPQPNSIASVKRLLKSTQEASDSRIELARRDIAAAGAEPQKAVGRKTQNRAQTARDIADLGLLAVTQAEHLPADSDDLGLAHLFYAIAVALSADAAESEKTACIQAVTATKARVRTLASKLALAIPDGSHDPITEALVATLDAERKKAKAEVDALADALGSVPDKVCQPQASDLPTLDQNIGALGNHAELAVAAVAQLRRVIAEVQPFSSDWTVLSDCVATIPHDTGVREAIVDVVMTHAPPAHSESDGGPPPPPPATHALVHFTVDHGKYYYDVVTVAGVVVDGQHAITTAPRPGQPGTSEIALSAGNHALFGVGLTVYPAGRRRQSYAVWDGNTRWWDVVGLQAGVDMTSLTAPFPTVFTGVAFEPVTGLAVGIGAAFEPMDKLINNYTLGDTPPAVRADYVYDKNVTARFYGSISIGYELFHTTGARLGSIGSNGTLP